MRSIRKTVKQIEALPRLIQDVRYVRRLPDGKHIVTDVPYQSQFASPELISDILDKKISAQDDPNWKSFGFATQEEAGYWAERMCGVACMKMLTDRAGHDFSVADLVREGVLKKGYDTASDTGWYHQPMADILSGHGISARLLPQASVASVARHVTNGRLFIASVNPQIIRFDDTVTSKSKGGHLVLVLGVRVENGKVHGFFLHNPSGRTHETRQEAYVPLKTFKQAFGNRGILITDVRS